MAWAALGGCTQAKEEATQLGVAPGPSPGPAFLVAGQVAASPGASQARAGSLAALVRWPASGGAVAKVQASLLTVGAAGPGAMAQGVAQDAELRGQQAYFRFPPLPGGPYRLEVQAQDAQGAVLAQHSQAVQVPEGQSEVVELALSFEPSPAPTPPRPSPALRPDLAGPAPVATAGPPAVASPRPSQAPPPSPMPSVLPPVPPPPGPPNLNALVARGLALDVLGRRQAAVAGGRLEAMLPGDRQVLVDAVATAQTELARIMLVKAAIAGEGQAALGRLAAALEGKQEPAVAALCLMRGELDLVQQWAASCGPAVVQTMQGEANPVRAMELHQEPVHQISPDLRCVRAATEQKQMLEAYGGRALPRSNPLEEGVGLVPMLNDHAGLYTQASYATEAATDLGAFARLDALVQAGDDVPLRLGFGALGAETRGHVVVALATRGPTGQREALIHDPETGKTAWVGEGAMRAGDFSAFFTGTTRWTHLVRPSPKPAPGLAFRLRPS